jgi:hypothetical protein
MMVEQRRIFRWKSLKELEGSSAIVIIFCYCDGVANLLDTLFFCLPQEARPDDDESRRRRE